MNPDGLSITLLRPEELEELLPLVREFYLHFGFPWLPEAKSAVLREILDHPESGRLWLARQNGQAAGYALVVTYVSLELGGRTAIVDEFHVTAPLRGLGIGQQLLEAVAQALTREGIRHLRLELDEHHAEAASLYQRQGFQRDGRELWTRRLLD